MSRFGSHLGGAALEHLREDEQAPYGPFFGQLGVTFSIAFAAAGAAYATAKVDLLFIGIFVILHLTGWDESFHGLHPEAGPFHEGHHSGRDGQCQRHLRLGVGCHHLRQNQRWWHRLPCLRGLCPLRCWPSLRFECVGRWLCSWRFGYLQRCFLDLDWFFFLQGFHGIQALSKQPKIFIGLVLIQAFASVLGLYGMLVGLTLLAA